VGCWCVIEPEGGGRRGVEVIVATTGGGMDGEGGEGGGRVLRVDEIDVQDQVRPRFPSDEIANERRY